MLKFLLIFIGVLPLSACTEMFSDPQVGFDRAQNPIAERTRETLSWRTAEAADLPMAQQLQVPAQNQIGKTADMVTEADLQKDHTQA